MVAAQVRAGAEVLICHPRLVQTGLDLVDWPSICWYETDYSVYVMRQASRRSWRIGQPAPVEVTFLVYEGTLQAEALALVAAKMRSALMVEGELPADGLAALEGDTQDIFVVLARRLAEQSAGNGPLLEGLFAQARAKEAEADGYLATGAWQTDAMPIEAGSARGGTEIAATGSGRVTSFEELAYLIRRPKARRKPIPAGQLSLFDA